MTASSYLLKIENQGVCNMEESSRTVESESSPNLTVVQNEQANISEVETSPSEEHEMLPTPSIDEPDAEDTTLLIDESDDESLISIPISSNKRKVVACCVCTIICFCYVLPLLVGVVVAPIIRLLVTNSTSSVILDVACHRPSGSGETCSTNNTRSVKLFRTQNVNKFRYQYYSYDYTAQSNRDVITFSLKEGHQWRLTGISIYDMSNNVEVLKEGSFESGTLNAYCVCDDNLRPNKLKKSWVIRSHSWEYDIDTFFSAVKLSQAVNTNIGHQYNVSFWLENRGLSADVSVYMSAG